MSARKLCTTVQFDHESRGRADATMKVIYTYTDEAPALATHSFLPVIEAFAGKAGVDVETRDISLAARVLAQFPDRLTDAGARRSELPSRSTGLTAEPFTRSYASRAAVASSVVGSSG